MVNDMPDTKIESCGKDKVSGFVLIQYVKQLIKKGLNYEFY